MARSNQALVSGSRLASVVYWPLFFAAVFGVAALLSGQWWGAVVAAVAGLLVLFVRRKLVVSGKLHSPEVYSQLLLVVAVFSVLTILNAVDLSLIWRLVAAAITGAAVSLALSLRDSRLGRFLALAFVVVTASQALYLTNWGIAALVVIPFAVPIAAGIARDKRRALEREGNSRER